MLKTVAGFRFICQRGCTRCCSVTGYVYLTGDDLKLAAAFLRLSPRTFERRYVYRTRHLLRLRKPRGSQCHFLTETGCVLHPAKPMQCRTFPFWPETVGSHAEWRKLKAYCPGIGKGALLPFDGALRIANQMREAYPEMYPIKAAGS